MKKVFVGFVVLLSFVAVSFADVYVNGHFDKSGNWVEGYYRKDANDTVRDNYSHKGNTNPHNGKTGSNKDSRKRSSEYYRGY
jgi:hypothetical protein